MPLTPAERQDRFQAAFLGLAIGDALGFPLRGIPPASLTRLTHLADDFAPRPRGKFAKGQFSDDTQLLLAASESVIREGKVDGRSAAAHFAWLWQEGVILQPPQLVPGGAQHEQPSTRRLVTVPVLVSFREAKPLDKRRHR